MCAGQILKAQLSTIAREFGESGIDLEYDEIGLDEEYNRIIWGFGHKDPDTNHKAYYHSPVIYFSHDSKSIRIDEFEFTLTPSSAKEFPLPYPTYNARMNRPKRDWKTKKIQRGKEGKTVFERIYQVPSYRGAFSKGQFCLVPLTAGIESSYQGEFNQQRFEFGRTDAKLIFATGIYEFRLDKETGELIGGYSLLTTFPEAQMTKFGHHREILSNETDFWKKLLDGKAKSDSFYDELREARKIHAYTATTYSKLKTRSGEPDAEDYLYPDEDLSQMTDEAREWIESKAQSNEQMTFF